jgi:Ca-activated chloride channel family protein
MVGIAIMVGGAVAGANGIIIPPWPPTPMPPRQPRPVVVSIKTHHVSVEIDNQVARTTVDEVFHNEQPYPIEGTFIFPLPSGAAVSDFAMYMDGRKVEGEVLTKEKARQVYEDIVRRMRDPALLEYMGGNLFRASIFPIPANGDQRIELKYTELLPAEAGTVRYVEPLATDKFSANPIGDLSISVRIKSPVAIKAVYSPSHDVGVHREGDYTARASYEAKDVRPDRDFVLYYTLSSADFGLHVLTHREAGKDGFFLLLAAPQSELSAQQIASKHVTFVLDTSGSMSGEKIEQARNALLYCVNALRADDRFNIIAFSDGLERFREKPVAAGKAEVEAARKFIADIRARGGTNIDEALRTAIAGADGDGPTFIVFLTDGQPTVGVTDVAEILARAAKADPTEGARRLRLFTFGVGHDVNTRLLDRLAQEHGGASDYVAPGEDIEKKVSAFFDKVSFPVLANPTLDFGGAEVREMMPQQLPDLFKGSQLLVVGRYRDGGPRRVVLTGEVGGKRERFTYEINLPAQESDNAFLPHLWAQRRIGYLLDEIRLHGTNKELEDEIIQLSLEYGIVTEYTSYLVTETLGVHGRLTADMPTRIGGRFLPRGDASGVGGPSVAASQSMAGMREAAVVPVSTLAEVRAVGGKTFYLRDGVWVDEQYVNTMPATDLAFGSDAYFQYLRAHADAGPYFSLGTRVIVVIDGRAIRVTEAE